MTEKQGLPFDLDEIIRGLPPREKRPDYARHNQAYIDMCVRDFAQMVGLRTPIRTRLADMTISLSKALKDGFGNTVKWIDSVIPEFDLAPSANFAYATRAVGNVEASESASKKMAFEKLGDDCSLKIELDVHPATTDVRMSLVDEDGRQILPFTLSVIDAESGETLLDRRTFTSGSANIKGVKKGRYEVLASGGDSKCGFTFNVE